LIRCGEPGLSHLSSTGGLVPGEQYIAVTGASLFDLLPGQVVGAAGLLQFREAASDRVFRGRQCQLSLILGRKRNQKQNVQHNPLASSLTRRSDTLADRAAVPKRINRNSKLFKTILSSIQEKKGEDIVSLDLRKIPEAVADFFFICEARSLPQIRAIIDHIEDQVKLKCGETPYRREGNQKMHWVLMDYVTIVVHVMLPENRTFYQLEEMWSDAEQMKHD